MTRAWDSARPARAVATFAFLGTVVLGGCTEAEPAVSTSQGASSLATPAEASPSRESTKVPTVAPSEAPKAATAPPALATDPPGRQTSVLEGLPGTADGTCVSVGKRADVRSGSMGSGNFTRASAEWAKSPTSKLPLYFIPADVRKAGELKVVVSRADGTASTTVRETSLQSADTWQYYLVQIAIPEAGKWRVKATDGVNSGCWDAEFAKS